MIILGQIGFYINQSICQGCKACSLACKDKNNIEVGINFRRVYTKEEGSYVLQPNGGFVQNVKSYYFSIACNHCEQPACLLNCPTGAITKNDENGVVTIDQEICAGTQLCVKACPYGGPQYNKETFKSNKCNFCMDLQEKGEDPVCVATCPLGAIEYGPIEELRKKYGDIRQIKGMPSPTITKPNIVITPHRDAKLV
ncbi:DMSO/selenate family reductase complex B subunit [Neobacillus sp. 179-J 1A1 HS]|uniref:DMSO/selenate family reductase complex B subunit n=1 Tax=Neobacillus driksii TaxID=3035913 RepID=UPI0035BC2372